jgi:hypothetical protein
MTKAGFIHAHSIVTRTGVFKYLNADGTIRRELRHPDDVFKQQSLDTLRRIPVTVNHPPELVNADNASKYQVGSTGDDFNVDGQFVMSSVTIHHKSGVDAVENGKTQWSLGYEVSLVDEVGAYNGEKYDCRQTEIEYNHLAIVDLARAGKEASLKMDSGNVISVSSDVIKQVSPENGDKKIVNDNQKEAIMKIIVIDGVAIQVEDAEESKLKAVVDAMNSKITDANAKVSAAQAKIDSLNSEVSKLTGELKTANSDSLLSQKIAARVALETDARRITGDSADFTGKSDLEVKKIAVAAFDAKANLDGGDAYISAYFDIAKSKTAEAGASRGDDGDDDDGDDMTGAASHRKDANTKQDITSRARGSKFDSQDDDRDAFMRKMSTISGGQA